MAIAFAHLFSQAAYRIIDFFRNWYVGSARVIVHRTIGLLESLDRSFALRVTIEHFFEPLYQDHSVIGHTLGILFRAFRVLMSVLVYLSIVILAAAFYLIWAGILTYALYRSIMYFPQ